MSLELKSEENILLVKHCIDATKYYTADAERIYYAIFQKIKAILIKRNFQYDKFYKEFVKLLKENIPMIQ